MLKLNRMMDIIIRNYGFENEVTIDFCTMCEAVHKNYIKIIVRYIALTHMIRIYPVTIL